MASRVAAPPKSPLLVSDAAQHHRTDARLDAPEGGRAYHNGANEEPAIGWRHRVTRQTGMRELLRTNDVVRLSWAQAQLRDAGIDSLVLDQHTSLVEGSIGAIPRRLMVAERDHARARAIIAAAEERLR